LEQVVSIFYGTTHDRATLFPNSLGDMGLNNRRNSVFFRCFCAINDTEVKLTFSKKLNLDSAEDATNYSVFINGLLTTDVIKDAVLQEDGKSVIVRFTTPLTNGDTYRVTTADNAILSSNYDKFPAYKGAVTIFNDTEAPKLVSSSFNGTNVELTFSELIDYAKASVKVNGVQLALAAPAVDEAGNYVYTVTGASTSVGSYNVVVNGAADSNGNTAGTLTGNYSIVADTTSPAVTSITAVGERSFKVTFNKAISGFTNVANHLVVKKGSSIVDNSRITPVVATDNKSVTFTVAADAAGETVPLYGTGETAVGLSVSFDSYKDANNLLGSPYTGSVTLQKDTVAPAIVSTNLVKVNATKTVVSVPFSKTVSAVVAQGANVVVKKDGIVQSSASVTPSMASDGNTLQLTFGSALTAGSKYTIELPKGIVVDGSNNENAAVSFDVNVAAATTLFQPASITPSSSNELVVDYGKPMTDSAKSLGNYTLDGAALPAGTTIDWIDNTNKVSIKLPSTYVVSANADYNLTISKNVTATDGTYVATATDGTYSDLVALIDNVAPQLSKVEFVKDATDASKFNQLKLTFSEKLTAIGDTPDTQGDFNIVINGSTVAVKAVTDGSETAGNVITLTVGDGIELFTVSQGAKVTLAAPVAGTTNATADVMDTSNNVAVTGVTVAAQ
jgi:hypothetical protein